MKARTLMQLTRSCNIATASAGWEPVFPGFHRLMIINIAQVLADQDLAALRAILDAARWVDGARTAGWYARQGKQNRQLDAAEPAKRQAQGIVSEALRRNEVFRAAALPRTTRPALFARYGPGEVYDTHVDDALMGNP